ncbi:MAG: putative toxin-antitoxin system toxin component, PIN family [Blastocatellales bacterium]
MADQVARAIFDCNVYLQAAANEEGPAGKAFSLFEREEILLFISDEVFEEVKDVMNRPRIRAAFPGLSDLSVAAFLKRLETKAILIKNIPEEFALERDPDDAKYVNLAIVTNAGFLVSKDNDLLDLMTAQSAEAQKFRTHYPFLRIMKAADFVREVEAAKENG